MKVWQALFMLLFYVAFPSLMMGQIVVDVSLPNKEGYNVLYDKAMKYYNDKNYEQTKNYLELALADKRFRHKMMLKCENRCTVVNDMTLRSLITKQKCFKDCMAKFLGDSIKPSFWVKKDFESRMTYSYLQYAYYKLDDLLSAYEAALTHLKQNPTDDMMQKNVKYYGKRINKEEARLREAVTTRDYFSSGMKSYNAEDFTSAANSFSNALKLFMSEVEECKVLCGVSYDEDDDREVPDISKSRDFYDQLVIIYTEVMECKWSCVEGFDALVADTSDENFLLQLLNYLQFSAYQAGNMQLASQAAQSYLYIRKDDVMSNNLKFYKHRVKSSVESLVNVDNFNNNNQQDIELLTKLVGRREMNNRLREKLKVNLGDSRKVSELNASSTISWGT